MPNPGVGEELRRVTARFFLDDIIWFEKRFGRGWQTYLREAVRDFVNKRRKENDD